MADTYIYVNGEQQGPISIEEIKNMVEDGRMGPEDQVWIQARNEWVMARNVAQFKRIFDAHGVTTEEQPATPRGLLVSINGEQYGPYPATQLIEFILEGRLSRQDFVWIERHEKWFELQKIVQFRQAFEKREAAEGATKDATAGEAETAPTSTAEPSAEEQDTAASPTDTKPEEAVAPVDAHDTEESPPAEEAATPPAQTEKKAAEPETGPVPDSDWSTFVGEDEDGTRPRVTDADIVRRTFSDRPGEAGSAMGTIGDFVTTPSGGEPPVKDDYVDPTELPLMKTNAAKRLGGLVWDIGICFISVALLGIIFYLLHSVFKDVLFFRVFNPKDTMSILEGAGFLENLSQTFIFISIGLIAFYLLMRDAIFGRRSPGKRLAGLRIVDRVTKQPPGIGKLILRNITVVTIAPLIIEFVLVLADKKGLRIGDRLSRTQVVDSLE